MSASSRWIGAGVERPRELAPPRAAIDAEDPLALVEEVRVRLCHRVDDDGGGLGQERLVAAEQPAVADRAPEDPAQHVAATLVGRQDAVGR